jgi:hypothetical protein
MVTLYREQNWKLSVYGREHGIPHFHIEGPEFRCSVAIETMEVIIGSAPPAVLRAATLWALANRAGIRAKWRELNT